MDSREFRRRALSVALAALLLLGVAPRAGAGEQVVVSDAGPQAPPPAGPARQLESQIVPEEIRKGVLDRAAEYLEPVLGEIDHTSLVPIPEIILDPNEGNTGGLMAVWMLLGANDDVRYIFAPDIRYNATKGTFPAFRLLAYPDPDRFWTVTLGKSTTRDEDYEAEYDDYTLLDGRAFVETKILYERDSTDRFFGFGNDSKQSAESNYTGANFYAEAMPAYYVLPQVALGFKTRIQHFEVQPGQVSSIPFILHEHPEVRGHGASPAWYWTNRLELSYDTRDSRNVTRAGTFAKTYVEAADRALGSATSFVRFGLEGRYFHPFRGERKNPVLATRFALDWMSGSANTPFWQMSSLGGRRLLRGFGSDRFIDFNRSIASMELRTRVWSPHLFGVVAEIELAPFVETGEVFHDVGGSPYDHLHWVYGLGFRGIVPPQIVAFVDIGKGSEGVSVFTGIDYPF
jgi:hypothetical protein